ISASAHMTHMAQTSAPTARPIEGAIYADVRDGREFVLAGLRSKGRVCLIHEDDGGGRVAVDYLPMEDFAAGYTYLRCNHEDYCCDEHGHHARPHSGCLFR
ncbi:MAG TPA: hypothetical protein VF885_00905, partial [Arthrobacter sp.]